MRWIKPPLNPWGWARLAGLAALALILLWTLAAAGLRQLGTAESLAWSGYASFTLLKGFESLLIDGLGDADNAAILTTGGSVAGLTLTSGKSLLKQALDGIEKGTPIPFDLEHARALTELLENAYKSDREQKIVEVPDK